MNIIDRLVTAFNPEAGMRRAAARKVTHIINGYEQGGASQQKKSMRGWLTSAQNPKDDIDRNLDTLRSRSRDLYMNGPIGASALKTTRTNVIGPGLRLKARINAELLGLTTEQADAWCGQVEEEFNLWAESKHSDAIRMNDFYDQQGIAFLGMLMNGDSFTVFKHAKRTSWMPYGLRIHLIEADRICTPQGDGVLGDSVEGTAENGNRIYSGVEIDDDGALVAYHIANTYATDYTSGKIRKWVRVEAYGKNTGRPNILHLMDTERAEQRRGVPLLAPVIETLKQITRYTEAELMAAVISAMFTVFIKTTGPTTDNTMGPMIPLDQQVAPDDPNNYEMGPGAINVLGQDEEIQIADPKRPNSNFDPFVRSLCLYVGAALEIPYELLLKNFQSSYSASRAALLEAWKMFRMRRQWTAKEFCQPIYEEWLAEAVALGRIRAPGFFGDPKIRKAWCKAEWNGPAPGQLDPVKEVEAAERRIALGLSTREREAIETNGSDFWTNIQQQKVEIEAMRAAGIQSDRPDTPQTDPGKEVKQENE
ncbi:phage portal protein [Paenibacillus campinasensis]|uniref:Phage portal protein n=1 Tax=Paenibacillus campinasensis TaxID=66347 RepID=A0A268ELJ8_9BACL|nr:phage portal protein [Paenibacillus campinasensis]